MPSIILLLVPIPEITSAEGFERYIGGNCLRASRGKAWRRDKAWIIAPPRKVDTLPLPSVSEPFLAWTISADVEFKERENNRPWITHRIRKGSFFLTSGGAPYDCRWKALTPEPFQAMMVFLELPLLQRALEECVRSRCGSRPVERSFGVYRCGFEFVNGKIVRRANAPKGEFPFRARKRSGSCNSSRSKLCGDQQMAQQ
jgi:hypothetical protein